MNDPHAARIQRLREGVLDGPGKLSPAVRQTIAGEGGAEIPPVLLPYLDKVAHHAYKVTDEDVQGLLQAGLSEDEIFEATVAAALGAGLKRLRAGLAALGEE